MWEYVTLIMSPIFIQHIRFGGVKSSNNQRMRKNNKIMMLFWCELFVLLVFRNIQVGIDLRTYERIYYLIESNDWIFALKRSPEIGWNVMCKFISSIGGNFRLVVLISSLISVFFIARAYIKYSNDAPLSIVLFMNLSNFILLFSGLRQSIAISLGALSFEFVRKRKVLPFLGVVIVAMLFHTSAFILLFMYPIFWLKVKRRWLTWIIPFILFIFIFNQSIFSFLGKILIVFTDYDVTIVQTGSYLMILLLVIFALFAFIVPNETILDDTTIGMRNFLLLSVIIQLFAPLNYWAMRMNYYYLIFIPLLLPKIIKCSKNNMRQIATLAKHVMTIFFIVYFFAVIVKNNDLCIFPYKFLWEV